MKYLRSAVLTTATFACWSVAARDRMVEGFPDLPRAAAAIANRNLACIHFGGEFTGTNGERDREVKREVRKLRCDSVEREMRAVRHKYRHNPAILKALAEADQE